MAEVEIVLSLAAMCSEGVLDAEEEHNLYCIYTGHNHSVLAWYGCGTVLSSLQGVCLYYKCITVPKQ